MSRDKISRAGQTEGGTLACPKCGGASFKAKRSLPAKMGAVVSFGAGALVIPKRWVKCQTCGATYKRG